MITIILLFLFANSFVESLIYRGNHAGRPSQYPQTMHPYRGQDQVTRRRGQKRHQKRERMISNNLNINRNDYGANDLYMNEPLTSRQLEIDIPIRNENVYQSTGQRAKNYFETGDLNSIRYRNSFLGMFWNLFNLFTSFYIQSLKIILFLTWRLSI